LHTEGVDPEVVDDSGQTAVHIAARRGETGVLKYLHSIHMDFRQRDGAGLTPLQCIPRYDDDFDECKKFVQKVLMLEKNKDMSASRNSKPLLEPLIVDPAPVPSSSVI
jgi:ankyrin repeat protein